MNTGSSGTSASQDRKLAKQLKQLDTVKKEHRRLSVKVFKLHMDALYPHLALPLDRLQSAAEGAESPFALMLEIVETINSGSAIPSLGADLMNDETFTLLASDLTNKLGVEADFSGKFWDERGEPQPGKETTDEHGYALRFFVAHIYLAGILHAKLLDGFDLLDAA